MSSGNAGVVMLTTHQRSEKAKQAQIAALATEALNDLPPDIVILTFEAHMTGRADIAPGDLERMADRIRRMAWAKERGEL